jgi:uncharacterized protein YheU (UPF0270 family)
LHAGLLSREAWGFFGTVDVPWQQLRPETLRALIEEFVSRDGTDYGAREADFETKVRQVRRLLESGQAKVVFDPETESCDIRERVGSGPGPA